jgi:hypothetical protein
LFLKNDESVGIARSEFPFGARLRSRKELSRTHRAFRDDSHEMLRLRPTAPRSGKVRFAPF